MNTNEPERNRVISLPSPNCREIRKDVYKRQEQQLAGATVSECVLPGVVHRPENAEDAEDYDVICRATVRLNN